MCCLRFICQSARISEPANLEEGNIAPKRSITRLFSTISLCFKLFFNWIANLFVSKKIQVPAKSISLNPDLHLQIGNINETTRETSPMPKAGLKLETIAEVEEESKDAEVEEESKEESDNSLKSLEEKAIISIVGQKEYDRINKQLEDGEILAYYNVTEKQKNELFHLPQIALKIVNDLIEKASSSNQKESFEKQKELLLQKFPELNE